MLFYTIDLALKFELAHNGIEEYKSNIIKL